MSTTSTCIWRGRTQPRAVRGRHVEDCETNGCPGCLPCTERHCQICGKAHTTVEGRGSDLTCAECLGETRNDLGLMLTLSERLMGEAEVRGVDSEAAALAGPAIDTPAGIEAFGYRRMSAIMGRIKLDQDDRHPLWVAGSWETLVRDHLDQPAGEDTRIHIWTAIDYLGEHLTRLAHDPEFPFDEMATEIRRCRGHLEDVLHDGEQVERTQVLCLDCGSRLERRYGEAAAEDHHACPRCRRTYNAGEFARAKADWLATERADRYVLIGDAAKAIDRSEYTIRTWIRRGSVGAMCDRANHRLMAWWPDVRDQHRAAMIRELQREQAPVRYDLNNDLGISHAQP